MLLLCFNGPTSAKVFNENQDSGWLSQTTAASETGTNCALKKPGEFKPPVGQAESLGMAMGSQSKRDHDERSARVLPKNLNPSR